MKIVTIPTNWVVPV